MARLTLTLEHLALIVRTIFETLALKIAHINTTKFCRENRLSPEICGCCNIFYYLPILLKLGQRNATLTGYR